VDSSEWIVGMADLLVPEDPRAFADKLLETLIVHVKGNRAALFSREQDQMHLFASRGVDQSILDAVSFVWATQRQRLADGLPFVASKEPGSPVVRAVFADVADAAILPVRARDRMTGLLYVDSQTPIEADALAAAEQLARLAAVALRAPIPRRSMLFERGLALETYLERVPPGEIAREQLLVLLERNEWNVSRVARLMGVTRRTIYLRLARYGIERKRVPKTLRRRSPAVPGAGSSGS